MVGENASPKATGGVGTAFEFKVKASFLATMLVNGRYPCLPGGNAQFIRFQARQLGHQTDDIFVRLQSPSGAMYRLLGQIKANIAFTQSSNEFSETLIAAWSDFINTELFNCDKDALVIISGPGSKKEIHHFRPLLGWSRSSVTAEEFFSKVLTPKHASEEMRKYLSTIQSLLKEHLGEEPDRDALWRFLKCLYWVWYDFDEPSGRDLATILTMLRLAMKDGSTVCPENIWAHLLKIVLDYDPAAGSFTRESLTDVLGDCVVNIRMAESTGIYRLKEHIEGILAIVKTHLRNGRHLERPRLLRNWK